MVDDLLVALRPFEGGVVRRPQALEVCVRPAAAGHDRSNQNHAQLGLQTVNPP
jgi:hypothetical protein